MRRIDIISSINVGIQKEIQLKENFTRLKSPIEALYCDTLIPITQSVEHVTCSRTSLQLDKKFQQKLLQTHTHTGHDINTHTQNIRAKHIYKDIYAQTDAMQKHE